MGLAQPAYREPEEPRRETAARRDPTAGFERAALPLSARELLPMAAILLLISAVAAVTIFYLTAFGRLTAQGAREQQLEREISQLQSFNQGLAGDIARLQRRDRLEREARRLQLAPFSSADTHRIELPPGVLDAAPSAPAPSPPAVSARISSR